MDSVQRWMAARRRGAVQLPVVQPGSIAGGGGERTPAAATPESETEEDTQRLRRRAAS